MLNIKSPELTFAIEAVNKASKLVKKVQSEMVSPALTKDDKSPVTVADFAAQALIAKMLKDAFPNDPLVAEEESAALQTPEEADKLAQVTEFVAAYESDATAKSVSTWIDYGNAPPAKRYWTLDPVDGTKGFLRGGQYVVALALIIDGQVEIGVIGCPHLTDGYIQDVEGDGSIVVAIKGDGTWLVSPTDPTLQNRFHVSDVNEPSQARLLRSFETGHTSVSHLDEIITQMSTTADPVLLDSQAKYTILASGHGDLLFRLISASSPDYKEKIWDQAAGSLVVQEAGGRVTDLDGKPLDFSQGRTLAKNRGVLASNGLLHEEALKAIAAAQA